MKVTPGPRIELLTVYRSRVDNYVDHDSGIKIEFIWFSILSISQPKPYAQGILPSSTASLWYQIKCCCWPNIQRGQRLIVLQKSRFGIFELDLVGGHAVQV
jgi:hypothetical protein